MSEASKLARAMVSTYGMYPEVVSGSINPDLLISDKVRNNIDIQVKDILNERLKVVKDLLLQNSDKLLILSNQLMLEETIDKQRVQQLLNL